MSDYEQKSRNEMMIWQHQMQRQPGFFNRASKKLQTRINRMIPEKIHQAITTAIKQMVRGMLAGAGHFTGSPLQHLTLAVRENLVEEKIKTYRRTATVEGGITGAGGILLGLADFPVLIGIKLKLLFNIAALYGYDANDFKERIYILHIFQLAFCSHEQRRYIYFQMTDWKIQSGKLPASIHDFDWRTFQQEYRDYIDLAKLAQLLPLVGAPVGAIVNYKLIKKLGHTAMNAYRMRWFGE